MGETVIVNDEVIVDDVDDEVIEPQKEYKTSEARRAAQKRYAESKKGRQTIKRHRKSDRYRMTQKMYNQSDKGQLAAQRRKERKDAESEDGSSPVSE